MVKKIVFGVSTFALAAAFPLGALAQSELSTRPIPYPLPWPPTRIINVTPNNPLDLNSCGRLEVKGRGLARIENFNGTANVSVKGKLAIKKEDLGDVKVTGFNHKHRRGEYIVYSGRGSAHGSSTDIDLVAFGTGKVESKGCGEISLKGTWNGTFQPSLIYQPIPEPPYPWPQPLPADLVELETETLAN